MTSYTKDNLKLAGQRYQNAIRSSLMQTNFAQWEVAQSIESHPHRPMVNMAAIWHRLTFMYAGESQTQILRRAHELLELLAKETSK